MTALDKILTYIDKFLTHQAGRLSDAVTEEEESPCAFRAGALCAGGSAAAVIIAAAAAVATAAAAIVIAAAVVSAVAAAAITAAIAAATAVAAAVTTAAEQDEQDDDPVTTEAVVIPHIHIPPVRCEAGKGLSSSYAGGDLWCQLRREESTKIRAVAS